MTRRAFYLALLNLGLHESVVGGGVAGVSSTEPKGEAVKTIH